MNVPVAKRPGSTTVLLIDDQPGLREWSIAIHAIGGTAVCVQSPDDALRYVVSACPDALIADVATHGRGGLDLISAIRALPEPAGTMKAVAICDRANNLQHQQALMAGFDLYLTTPLSPDVVARTVARLLGL